jgi:hypothetical protein
LFRVAALVVSLVLFGFTALPGIGRGVSCAGAGTIWQAAFPAEPDGSGHQAGRAALDKDGNIILSGFVEGKNGNYDCLTLKYAPDGKLLWSRTYDYSWYDVGFAVTTGRDGSVYVACASHDLENPGDMALHVYYTDYVLLKYTPDGELVFDVAASGFRKNNEPSDIAAGGDGSIYLTGSAKVTTDTYSVYYTVKFSPSGELLWEKVEDWGVDARATAIAKDSQGNMLVTGYYKDPVNGNDDIRTLRYSPSNGKTLMDKTFIPPDFSNDEEAHDIAVLSDDGFVVTGYTSYGGGNTLTVAFTPDGETLWDETYQGASVQNKGRAVGIGQDGRTFVLANMLPSGEGSPVIIVYDGEGRLEQGVTLDYGGLAVTATDLLAAPDGELIAAATEAARTGAPSIILKRVEPPPPRTVSLRGADVFAGNSRLTLFRPAMPMLRTILLTRRDVSGGSGQNGTVYEAKAAAAPDGYEYRFYVSRSTPLKWEPVTDYTPVNCWYAPPGETGKLTGVMVHARAAGSELRYEASCAINLAMADNSKKGGH